MKSNSIELMQKSFLASLILSFVFAFATAAYLASPVSIKIQTVTAEADETPIATTTPDRISFGNLNLITLIEATTTDPLASSTENLATAPELQEPAIPATGNSRARSAKVTAHPVRLIIPAIGLDTEIDPMGVNAKGEMDVPDGSSDKVGWYKYGTIPGNVGSAVLDAHVFAAFEDLNKLPVGSAVFIVNSDGEKLEFRVDDANVYELGNLTPGTLFSRRDARRLNLITCAGEPVGDTYSHRLVVFTTLV